MESEKKILSRCSNVKKLYKIFGEEMDLLSDTLREVVELVFEHLCPSYFWTAAATSTGKHHPKISQGPGGLVSHTKLAVRFGSDLLTVMMPNTSRENRDSVIAALILHDLRKFVDSPNKMLPGSTYMHGELLATQIRALLKSIEHDMSSDFYNMIIAIKLHMGQWSVTNPLYYNYANGTQQKICDCVHMADYIASRKTLDLDFLREDKNEK